MKAATRENKDHLFERITGAMLAGGQLTHAILTYIETALFFPEPDRLAAFLSDDTDCERDSLLDLIFYPDEAVQISMEPMLEAARYSVDDENALHDRLIAHAVEAPVNMPDGSHLAYIQVPDYIKSQYLKRLNLSWRLDPGVAAAIESGVPAALGPIVKVRLRNAGICAASDQQVFLRRFFERMADSDPDFLACLDLVLSILDTAGERLDVYDLLVEHKRSLFRGLQQAKRFDALLAQSNMETLMLQGVRAPHVSRKALIYHMRLIDLVCFGVFGKTEAIESLREESVRQVSDMENPGAIMQSLLR